MIKDLDRVYKLGYDCEIVWKDHIEIYFDFTKQIEHLPYYDPLMVLTCMYNSEIMNCTFEKFVEEVCEFVYSWYNDHHKEVQDYIKKTSSLGKREGLESICLGDITRQITRHFQIDDIIDDYDNY